MSHADFCGSGIFYLSKLLFDCQLKVNSGWPREDLIDCLVNSLYYISFLTI